MLIDSVPKAQRTSKEVAAVLQSCPESNALDEWLASLAVQQKQLEVIHDKSR